MQPANQRRTADPAWLVAGKRSANPQDGRRGRLELHYRDTPEGNPAAQGGTGWRLIFRKSQNKIRAPAACGVSRLVTTRFGNEPRGEMTADVKGDVTKVCWNATRRM